MQGNKTHPFDFFEIHKNRKAWIRPNFWKFKIIKGSLSHKRYFVP